MLIVFSGLPGTHVVTANITSAGAVETLLSHLRAA